MAQYRTDTKKLDGASLVTRHEVMMLSDRLTPGGTATDAFGRLRVCEPLTVFDSQHRYQDNGLWNTANTVSANTEYKIDESAVNLNVDTVSGHYVYRETTKVFAYQPGKSLLVLNTFVFNTPKANLRQRVGFFSSQNGVFFESDGTTNYLVLRSYVTGVVQETRVAQTDWNVDRFDGTGYSAQGSSQEHRDGIDVSKANIFWIDIEWLGVGDVRCGFVVDGLMVPAHVFHNDNLRTTTYMTTACLPCRYEIENTGTTASNSTLKQICTSVISEGGYTLIGKQSAVTIPLTTPKDLPTAGTFVPVISIRLKPDRLDAVVIPEEVVLLGLTNNTKYVYKVVVGGTLDANASWVNVTSSAVQYDISATGYTGGSDVAGGYLVVSSGAGAAPIRTGGNLFENQLQRNSFTNTATVFSLVATGAGNGDDAVGGISWQEITR